MVPQAPAEGEVVFGEAAVGFEANLAASSAGCDDGPFVVVAEGVNFAGKPELANERGGDGVEFVVLQCSSGKFESIVDQALAETD